MEDVDCFLFWGLSDGIVSAAHHLRTQLGIYAQNLLMLQWVSVLIGQLRYGVHIAVPWHNPRLVSSVYWSLNYEEQFYLILGGILAFSRRVSFVGVWIVLTAFSVSANIYYPRLITGLFFDYWIQFAFGVALFLRLFKMQASGQRKLFDGGLVFVTLVLGVGTVLRHEYWVDRSYFQSCLEAFVCSAFALILVLLWQYDRFLGRSFLLKPLFWLGTISYSLYLTHPIVMIYGDLIYPLRARVGDNLVQAILVCTSIGVATAFYFVFERPSLRYLAKEKLPSNAAKEVELREPVVVTS